MLYELARALIQRIIKDKLILGMLIILIVGIFMGGINSKDEKPQSSKVSASDTITSEQQQGIQQLPAIAPDLANSFVKWWLPAAMDFSPASAIQSHEQAFAWMTADAQQSFQAAFWAPQTASAVVNHQLSASFHPTTIQAKAINPDGSVVVGVTGSLIVNTGGQPAIHLMSTDFLVRRDKDGLRIAGMFSQAQPIPGSSVY